MYHPNSSRKALQIMKKGHLQISPHAAIVGFAVANMVCVPLKRYIRFMVDNIIKLQILFFRVFSYFLPIEL
jgi:hypothetical protein